MQGSKIMYMKYRQKRFVDSLSHTMIPLKAFAKTFGLDQSTYKKGDFPYKLISKEFRPEDFEWIGTMPHIKYFNAYSEVTIGEYLKYLETNNATELIYELWYDPKEHPIGSEIEAGRHHYDGDAIVDNYYHKADIELLKWYNKCLESKYDWQYQHELELYCVQDVNILMEGMEKMRGIFKNLTQSDPLSYITLASHCLAIYTSYHMPENSIPINIDEFNKQYISSKKCKQWLAYNGITSHEYRLDNGLTVDGYDEKTTTAYEFQGCFWHGCRKCYGTGTNPVNHKTYDTLYRNTQAKLDKLRQSGYKVIEIWEHDFDNLVKIGTPMPDIDDSTLPLRSKDSMFGGRTETFRAWNEPDENLKYIDFTSLYPYINRCCEYPSGTKRVMKEPSSWDKTWFGFAKVTISPPKDLKYPLLPNKRDKLYFDLHDSTGTWTTIEISKAIELGYKINKIHEVWHYSDRRSDLFKSYVDTFMKIKHEASGWPRPDMTEADKLQHCEELDLDGTKVCKNPGLRSIAKLCLNSLWGKFGQNLETVDTVYVTDEEEYYRQIANSRLKRADNLDSKTIVMKINSEQKQNFKTSMCVAAFTTAHARLKLYNEVIDVAKDDLYYCDTDSGIVGQNVDIKTSELLGDLKDELAEYGSDAYIDKYVSSGAKSYAYRVVYTDKFGRKHHSSSIKAKGIHQPKYTVEDLEKVVKEGTEITDIPTMVFKKQQKDGDTFSAIKTVNGEKKVGCTLDKRVFDSNGQSLPHGYVKKNPSL